MGITIALANQKGGVGKTTSAINIASSLGILGKKTLLCDMDPQANATGGVGINKRELSCSIYDVLVGKSTAAEAICKTNYKNLSVLPSSISLAGAEIELLEFGDRERFNRLRTAIGSVSTDYDFIIIDCPPSLGMLTLNALCACDSIIVAMQCEYFALEGLSQLTTTIRQVKRLYNPPLELGGILISMYDSRLNLSMQVLEEIKKYFPDKILPINVPRTVRLGEAPSYGMPVYYYDKSCKANDCFLALAEEIIKRNSI